MIDIKHIPDYPSVYDSFEDVPDHLRLRTFEDDYADVDLWAEFLEDQYSGREYGQRHLETMENAGNEWREFCADRGRHYAFAHPGLIKDWCAQLREDYSKATILQRYLRFLMMFYRYLLLNVEYPHVYNPCVYAVHEYELVESIWTWRGREVPNV